LQIYFPKKIMDWIDANRGSLSRQTFIIKVIEQRIITDPNLQENLDGEGAKEDSHKRGYTS